MKTKNILVAYATKHGATAEIADWIAAVLKSAGLAVDIKLAHEVSNLEIYDAVVLGSAVYAGQWRREATEFLENNEQLFLERPTWLFSSGPTGTGDPIELMKGWQLPHSLQPLVNRIEPRGIVFFGGVLDMEKLNIGEKLIIKALRAPIGDFRNRDQINAWAMSIAATCLGETEGIADVA